MPGTPLWMGIATFLLALVAVFPKVKSDLATASKAKVEEASMLARQALDLLQVEREVSKDRSEENQRRLAELDASRFELERQLGVQAMELLTLRAEVKKCHEERDLARADVFERTAVIERRRLKIVELEARIAELESKSF